MGSYAKGKKAFGFCDRCGFRYDLKDLKTETVNLATTNLLVCPVCWDPDQPQNMLGRVKVDDPQALRNPRPLGGISGRELSYAQRWEFVSVTELTNPIRFNGWHGAPGSPLSYNSAESMLTLAPTSGYYIMNGYNQGASGNAKPDNLNLGIDASVYKYATAMVRMNNFPTEPGPPDGWRGLMYWGNDTTITNGLTLTHLIIDASGNATFTYTYSGTSQVAVGNRYNFYNLSGTYNGSDISALNDAPAAPDSGFLDKYMVTAVTESTFTVSGTGITGDGSTLALSGSPSARCPYPFTNKVVQENTERPTPYFLNSQPSSGFLASQKSLGTYFKFIWDLSDHEYWTGTISTIRLDFFQTAVGESGGSMDIQWIAVQSYHNPDL
jgi:hypothetical protein